MCGIFAIIGTGELRSLRGMLARGPDAFNCVQKNDARLYHSRLAIVGLNSTVAQPFVQGDWMVTVNGEIYNHRELGSEEGASDCSVIISLLQTHTPAEVCRMLNGVFSFVAHHVPSRTTVVARDPIGVTPLYTPMEIRFTCPRCETFPSSVKRKDISSGSVGIFETPSKRRRVYATLQHVVGA